MPICTTCTHPTPYLYTIYNSEDNLRLEQCSSCHEFADPYVEHDILTLWLDLILLKRDVYRHLLFNRGEGERRLGVRQSDERDASDTRQGLPPQDRKSSKPSRNDGERARWLRIIKLGSALIAMDAFIRWTHISTSISVDAAYAEVVRWNQEAVEGYLRILAGCLVETLGFHSGVMLSSFIVLRSVDWVRAKRGHGTLSRSGIRSVFRYSHIPLTIFYSSFNKLFLLFLLTIWRPASASHGTSQRPLPPQHNASNLFTNPMLIGAMELLDDDKLDREWIVRNVLGGMAAGFGLRVVLDCHPVFTTIIILAGWALKTALANIVSSWVGAGIGMGGDEQIAGEMWLAYSIP